MYKVGQVLYVLSANSLKLVPIQVVEERIVNKITGRDVTFMVQLPPSKKGKRDPIPLQKVTDSNEVYTTLEEAKKQMLENSQSAIMRIVKNASRIAEKYFDHVDMSAADDLFGPVEIDDIEDPDDSDDTIASNQDDALSEDTDVIMLPDGTKRRVKANIKVGDSVKQQLG